MLALVAAPVLYGATAGDANELKSKADSGDAAALAELVQLAAKDDCGMTDREIIRYCTLAAGQNNVDAQVLLYAFFSQGKHTPANREMASVWEEGILNSGSADAIFKLAKWKMENGATLAERLSGKDLCKKAADMGCGDAVQYQEERTAPPPPVSPPRTVNTRSTENRSDLAPLINRMRALKCKHADSAEQQRHLLVLLPMIQDGADVDVTTSDSGGHTALHYSCAIGSLSITRWLVYHGANVNAMADNGDTPLAVVGADNRAAITQLLIDHGAGGGQAAHAGVHGGAANASSAGGRGDLQPMIDRMAALRCREESSKLYQKRLLMLLPMIRDGADVNITTVETKGNTALHYAVAIGSLSITRWLLEHGANPNAVTDKGASVLQCVGADNGAAIRRLLIQYGAEN